MRTTHSTTHDSNDIDDMGVRGQYFFNSHFSMDSTGFEADSVMVKLGIVGKSPIVENVGGNGRGVSYDHRCALYRCRPSFFTPYKNVVR